MGRSHLEIEPGSGQCVLEMVYKLLLYGLLIGGDVLFHDLPNLLSLLLIPHFSEVFSRIRLEFRSVELDIRG